MLTVLPKVFTIRHKLRSLDFDKPSGSSTVISDAPRLLLFPLDDSEGARSTPAVLLPLESVCRRVTRLTFGCSSSISSSMASLDVSALGSFVSAVMDDPDSFEGRVSAVSANWLVQHNSIDPILSLNMVLGPGTEEAVMGMSDAVGGPMLMEGDCGTSSAAGLAIGSLTDDTPRGLFEAVGGPS